MTERPFLPAMAAWFIAAACVIPSSAAQDDIRRHITDKFAAGVLIRPAGMLESRLGKLATDTLGKDQIQAAQQAIQQATGLDIGKIQTLLLLVDSKTMHRMAGVPPASMDEGQLSEELIRNNLKQIMLAMHNFHDTYRHFPDQDGDRQMKNLSWRVYLLPFLEEAALYEQFKLDQPWDSDHNKALIAQMPDVFRSAGVDEEGKTAIHGLAGEKTLMDGTGPVPIRNIIDGTSNTIALVQAGADKADIWTRPTALEVKDGPPSETLGKVGSSFLAGFADGSVRSLSAKVAADDFRALVGYADQTVVRTQDLAQAASPPPLPSLVIQSRTAIDQQAVLRNLTSRGGEQKEFKLNDLQGHAFGDYQVVFPNERTMISAPKELLQEMLNSDSASGTLGKRFSSVEGDAAVAVDLQQLEAVRKKIGAQIPIGAMVESIDYLQLTLDVRGTTPSLAHLSVETSSDTMAGGVAAVIQGGLEMQKVQLMQAQQRNVRGVPPILLEMLQALVGSTTVNTDAASVHVDMPRPKDYDRYVDDMRPLFVQLADDIRSARKAAAERRELNQLRQVGLAFHNYHDVYKSFPRYDGDAQRNPDDARRGLSWRVQLLPFLGHAKLFDQFQKDEPWDSEANRRLIEKMPDVFKTAGVDEAGHTSLHVFIGEKAMFGDGADAPRFRDILDGTSNTLLVVEAGPDTAEIWTKPGGLKFDGENGIELLGNIGDQFLAVFADGAVRRIPKTINEATLHRLIQHNDGDAIEPF